MVNAAVAGNSPAAARCWKDHGLTSDYPAKPRDSWVRCLQAGILGPEPRGPGNRTGNGADPRVLAAAFERGLEACKL